MLGRLLFQFKQHRQRRAYDHWLKNGAAVWKQNEATDAGRSESLVGELDFRDGPTFALRDGESGAHTFREIFLRGDYRVPALAGARVIVDVGANVGLFSHFAGLEAPSATIHAFEADPATYALLARNLSALADDRFHPTHAAVASAPGVLEFFAAEVSGWSSRYPVLGAKDAQQVTVPAIRLSDYLREHSIPRVDLLKIDVEGAEFDILLGDTALWNVEIRALVVEIDRTPRPGITHTFEQLLALLRGKFSRVEEKKSGEYPVFYAER